MKIEGMQGSFFIEYLCSCGLPVVRMRDMSFACVHCDSVCKIPNCFECRELMLNNGDEEDEE
jgi:hypothetical protein